MIALPPVLPRLHSLSLILGLCGVIVAAAALGQAPAASAEPEERWYKVELLVFRHLSTSAVYSEGWNPTPSLEYPGASRFLVPPETVKANLEQYDATGIVDEFGRQILTVEPPLLDAQGKPLPLDEFGNLPLLDDYGNALLDEFGDPVFPGEEELPHLLEGLEGDESLIETTLAIDKEATPEADSEPLPMKPTPFIALGSKDREFSGKAALMGRSGRYQILFHESWVQPVLPQADALPIVLDRSGDSQDWPALQGSIKLFVSRYLHLETNLWLNTMGEYLTEGWQIPPAPLGPQSLIIEYRVDLPEILPESAKSDLPQTFSEISAEQTASGALNQSEQTREPAQEWDWEAQESWDFDDPMEADPVYPWSHAIVLQQKRKMRSTEVHYIDHPMFGVVVLVSPITEEELDAMATTEQLAAEAKVEAAAADAAAADAAAADAAAADAAALPELNAPQPR